LAEHGRYAEQVREEFASHDREADRDRRRRRVDRVGASWRALRRQVLSEEPRCRICGEPATEVDHIVRARGGESANRENLQALCTACHRTKTEAEENARWEPWRQFKEAHTAPPGVDLVRVSEVAERLGVQHATVRRWVSRGSFPPIEIVPGKASVEWWLWSEVEAWARQTGRI
jgi:predicted DNA-binding transcriptional regulator AlpA